MKQNSMVTKTSILFQWETKQIQKETEKFHFKRQMILLNKMKFSIWKSLQRTTIKQKYFLSQLSKTFSQTFKMDN